ncbi:MAG TPA: PQQ-binding-like beta-propeller repeat protein [Nannocystis sp.]
MNYIPFILVIALGCTPKSLGLGDTDDAGDSGDSSGPATSGDPTTGTPGSDGLAVVEGIGGSDLAVGADGSIVVIGQSGYASDPYVNYNLATEGFQNDWIGKFDAAGAPIWVHETPSANPGGSPFAVAVAIGPDGGIHVAWTDSLHKLDPAGKTLWTRPLSDFPRDLAVTADGRTVVASEVYIDLADMPLVQIFAPDGAPLVEQAYDRPEYHEPGIGDVHVHALALDEGDGTVVLAGENSTQAWLLRADLESGALLWHQPITEAMGYGQVGDIGISADGTILALVGDHGTKVRAYSRAGELLWSFVPTVVERPNSLAVAADGSFALTDAVILPGIHPLERCSSFECPERTRVERRAADRSLMWAASNDECKEGRVVAVTPGDGVVVLGQCSKPPYGPYSIGLLQYAL